MVVPEVGYEVIDADGRVVCKSAAETAIRCAGQAQSCLDSIDSSARAGNDGSIEALHILDGWVTEFAGS